MTKQTKKIFVLVDIFFRRRSKNSNSEIPQRATFDVVAPGGTCARYLTDYIEPQYVSLLVRSVQVSNSDLAQQLSGLFIQPKIPNDTHFEFYTHKPKL